MKCFITLGFSCYILKYNSNCDSPKSDTFFATSTKMRKTGIRRFRRAYCTAGTVFR